MIRRSAEAILCYGRAAAEAEARPEGGRADERRTSCVGGTSDDDEVCAEVVGWSCGTVVRQNAMGSDGTGGYYAIMFRNIPQ
jgi:hypothetical protein